MFKTKKARAKDRIAYLCSRLPVPQYHSSKLLNYVDLIVDALALLALLILSLMHFEK